MPYTKQPWVDNDVTKPVSAARMSVLEEGIETAHENIDALDDVVATKAPTSSTRPVIWVENASSIPNRVVPAGYSGPVEWDCSAVVRTQALVDAVKAKMSERDIITLRPVGV